MSEAAVQGDEAPTVATLELSEIEDRLRKEGWYLGEMTVDTAASMLTASDMTNTFVVYRCPDIQHKFVVSARFHVDDLDEDIFEDLTVETTDKGQYKLTGQSEAFDDIIDVVYSFVQSTNPPLQPALRGRSFETQLSLTDAPPDYDKANRVLKPDIAPLPNIAAVKVEDPKEAQVGRISPGSSLRNSGNTRRYDNLYRHSNRPSYLGRSIWRRYEYRHRCHPKNVCHGCCHRPEEWTGYRVRYTHKWYDCRGSGPLRAIGLVLFWMLCGICFGCFKSWAFLCTLCIYFCCYGDSWS